MSARSCVRLGYFSDPYVHYFVKHPAIRPPLINRGRFDWWLAGLEWGGCKSGLPSRQPLCTALLPSECI